MAVAQRNNKREEMMEYATALCTQVKLQKYVSNFFQVSSDTPIESLLVPSGRQYIVFHLQGRATYRHGNKCLEFHNDSLLVYVHHEFYKLSSSENFLAFGIAMEPNGIYQFLGRMFSKDDFFLTPTQSVPDALALEQLSKELRDADSFKYRTVLAERFLFSKLNRFRKGTLVSRFLEITKNKDLSGITTRDLASLLYTNQRSLELKFCAITGTTPGKYLKLKRFVQLFQDFSSGDYSNKELILKYNYTDYSHLSRDFVKHTGKTPTAIKHEKKSLYYSLLAMRGA